MHQHSTLNHDNRTVRKSTCNFCTALGASMMSRQCLRQARFASAESLAAQRSLCWQSSQASRYHPASWYPSSTATTDHKQPEAHVPLRRHNPAFIHTGHLHATSCSSLLLYGLCTHKSQLHSHSGQEAESKPGIKAAVPKPSLNVRERINGYLRESLLLSYTALFDNVIFRGFELLRLDKTLKWLTPHLEDGYARVTGTSAPSCRRRMQIGERERVSAVQPLHTLLTKSIPVHADHLPMLTSSCKYCLVMLSHASTVLVPHTPYHSGSSMSDCSLDTLFALQATGTSLQMDPVAPSHLSTTHPLTSASQSSTMLLISHSTAQLNPQPAWPSTAPLLSPPSLPTTVPQSQSLGLPQSLTQPVCIEPTC